MINSAVTVLYSYESTILTSVWSTRYWSWHCQNIITFRFAASIQLLLTRCWTHRSVVTPKSLPYEIPLKYGHCIIVVLKRLPYTLIRLTGNNTIEVFHMVFLTHIETHCVGLSPHFGLEFKKLLPYQDLLRTMCFNMLSNLGSSLLCAEPAHFMNHIVQSTVSIVRNCIIDSRLHFSYGLITILKHTGLEFHQVMLSFQCVSIWWPIVEGLRNPHLLAVYRLTYTPLRDGWESNPPSRRVFP